MQKISLIASPKPLRKVFSKDEAEGIKKSVWKKAGCGS